MDVLVARPGELREQQLFSADGGFVAPACGRYER
jgi:hypothetical protein